MSILSYRLFCWTYRPESVTIPELQKDRYLISCDIRLFHVEYRYLKVSGSTEIEDGKNYYLFSPSLETKAREQSGWDPFTVHFIRGESCCLWTETNTKMTRKNGETTSGSVFSPNFTLLSQSIT